jgi:hypothetical protein
MKREKQPFTRSYRFCDHWCPDCLHRPRCTLHTGPTRSRRRKAGQKPDEWETAVQEATRSFEETRWKLREAAEERAAELLALTKKDVAAASLAASIHHPLTGQGLLYQRQCERMAGLLRAAFDEASRDVASRSGFMDVGRQTQAAECLEECARVLRLDAATVVVKARRALEAWFRAKMEAARAADFAPLEEAFLTAAVVLRCLARDEAALRDVYEYDEEFRSQAIDLLACGAGIGKALVRLLPGAAALANVPRRRGKH